MEVVTSVQLWSHHARYDRYLDPVRSTGSEGNLDVVSSELSLAYYAAQVIWCSP